MKRIGLIFIIAVSVLLAACSSNDEHKAKEVVTSFYQTHQAARPSGPLTLKELITFRHFMSVPLFDLLKDLSMADEARAAQNAAAPSPPLVEGDLFTSHPGGASTFRIINCDMQESVSTCNVELIYSDAKLQAPSKWTDRVVLNRDARGWVIDNIEYAGGAAPMRSGDLQKVMRTLLHRDTPVLQ
ncbi:hypothetical protein PQR62_01845 [Herbaspirillum lusitanum]|uniref:DUF3828 domain-containing protein n=1 Tax=Herbaspirillum lusitanum TaxID=213312 RepID=A0ABW9A3N8_9BURK